MPRILTKREKLILYATIGIVIFSIIFNLIIEPILEKNINLNKEVNLNRAKLKKYLWLLSQKEYLQSRYNKFSQTLQAEEGRKDDLVTALSELENLAKTANIRILDMRPQSPKALNLYKEMLIELRTEGDLESYLKFIYDIENSLSLFRIKKFQLNAKPNSQVLEANFSIAKLSLD